MATTAVYLLATGYRNVVLITAIYGIHHFIRKAHDIIYCLIP